MDSTVTTLRQKAHFRSGDTTCAAWHYPGINGGCVATELSFLRRHLLG